MERILVPLDGSEFAESALDPALELARASGAELHLVQVHEYVLPFPRAGVLLEEVVLEEADTDVLITPRDARFHPDPLPVGLPDEAELHEQARREDAERLIVLAESCAARAGVRARTELLDGDVVPALAGYIAEAGIDCVVMTTHGRGGLSRVWLGSVADALVRNTHAPVLLLRPVAENTTRPGLATIRRILVPLDGSPLAERMLPPACSVARAIGASLLLMHAVPPNRPQPRSVIRPAEAFRLDRARVEGYLDAFAARLRDEGVDASAIVSIHASPALAILEAADNRGDTMIALATHGRGGWARIAIGSVADKVLRAAVVPVLMLRPPAAADDAPVATAAAAGRPHEAS